GAERTPAAPMVPKMMSSMKFFRGTVAASSVWTVGWSAKAYETYMETRAVRSDSVFLDRSKLVVNWLGSFRKTQSCVAAVDNSPDAKINIGSVNQLSLIFLRLKATLVIYQ